VDVNPWIRRHCSGSWLIDVGFALQMQSATSHIRDTSRRPPRQFSLHREVPVPRFRVPQISGLRSDHQRNLASSTGAEAVNGAVSEAGARLEGRVATEKD